MFLTVPSNTHLTIPRGLVMVDMTVPTNLVSADLARRF